MNNLAELLNTINQFPEDTLLEKLISYCEQYDIDPQELGDELVESEQFKRMLWIDCVKHNSIKDEKLSEKLDSTDSLDEW